MTSAMSPDSVGSNSPNAEISLLEIINAVLRNWRAVLILPILFALFTGVWALNGKRSYYATASFVPQSAETRGSLSGAAALAQQFGVSIGGQASAQSPQFYEGLLRSATILRRAVESELDIPASDSSPARKGTLIQYWGLDKVKDPTPAWKRGADRLRGAVGTSIRRETGVIDLTVTSNNPVVAEQVAARLLELLNDYNLEVRQTRAHDEAKFVSGRLTDAQAELRAAEDALESFLRQNRGDFRRSPDLNFQYERIQRQVSARQDVYTSLLRAQEQARIDGMRDTPVLQVIDGPIGSAQGKSRKVALRTVVAFLMGLLVAMVFAIAREFVRRGRMNDDPNFHDFQDIARDIWNDIRNPRRWLAWRGARATSRG
jgi:uncharacterized protein involved in exopolysaccharide biosynthesis